MTTEQIRNDTVGALARVNEMIRGQDDLALALGRVTMTAADVEMGLRLLVVSAVGERSVILTESAPASVHLKWVRSLADDPVVVPADRAKSVKALAKKVDSALGSRNRLVHAVWLQMTEGRYEHLALKRSGDGYEGGHKTLDEIYEVEAELLECAGELRDLRIYLTEFWGGDEAPRGSASGDVMAING